MERDHFRKICADHITSLVNRRHAPGNEWMQPHIDAWYGEPRPAHNRDTRGERAIRDGIVAFAMMCDAHLLPTPEPGDAMLGDDGYFHEHATNIVYALRAYLNFDCGRFNCGTLDSLICKLAREAHVNLDD